MRVIDLALKDLLQMVRDWRAFLFMLAMPIAFTMMFGLAFGGFGGTGEDPRLPIDYVNLDDGLGATLLIELLEESQIIRMELSEDELTDLEDRVAENDVAAAVIIPAGYSQGLMDGYVLKLTIIANAGNNASITAQGEIQAGAIRLIRSAAAAQMSVQQVAERAGFASEAEKTAHLEDTMEEAVAAWEDPPVTVSTTKVGGSGEEESAEQNAFSQSSPGMMAQFAIAGLMGASTVVVMERKSRALRRLLTTAISRTEILLGHWLAMFAIIFVQLAVLVLFGQLLLRLDYLREPVAVILLVTASAAFVASMGLLIGALANSEDQVIVFALIPMFVLSGLGGAWMPLELTPEGFQRIAKLTPVAWMVDGFKDIIIRGLGLDAVILGLGVLFAYAAVLFALAVWQFRFE